MVYIIGQGNSGHIKAPSIYKACRALDSKWGRLEHRLVRIMDCECAWTCPTCRTDNVYDPKEAIQDCIARLAECCESALRIQFPEWKDPFWAKTWGEREALKLSEEQDERGATEESVRPGGEGRCDSEHEGGPTGFSPGGHEQDEPTGNGPGGGAGAAE